MSMFGSILIMLFFRTFSFPILASRVDQFSRVKVFGDLHESGIKCKLLSYLRTQLKVFSQPQRFYRRGTPYAPNGIALTRSFALNQEWFYLRHTLIRLN